MFSTTILKVKLCIKVKSLSHGQRPAVNAYKPPTTDLQSLLFDLVGRHNQLSNFLVWNFLLVAVLVRQMHSLNAQLGFQAARLVVDASVNHAAKIKAGGVNYTTRCSCHCLSTDLLWPDWWNASLCSFSTIAIFKCGCRRRISRAEETPTIPPPTQIKSNLFEPSVDAAELRNLILLKDLEYRESNILENTRNSCND